MVISAMNNTRPFVVTFSLLLCMAWLPACGQGTTSERRIKEHDNFARLFEAGDTNAPLLAMDWFSDHGVYFCRVSQAGNVRSARDAGHAIQGGSGISSRFLLGSTNRLALEAAIDSLPASLKKSLPKERRILISGIRSNHWFTSVYDRAEVPVQVEKLYEITDAYLGWYIPKVNGRNVARLERANFSGHFSTVATDADLAVSFGQWVTNGAHYYPPLTEFWTLEKGIRLAHPPFRGIPQVPSEWQGVAVSPDGSVLAVAIFDGLYVVNAKTGNLLWKAPPLDHDAFHGTGVAIGDKGKTLYTAGAHVIERRDLPTGRKLATLSTNELIVKFLKVSQDGSTLVAGMGDRSTTSFAVWDSGKNEPALRFASPQSASVGISPDGQTLVMCHWPGKSLEIWQWKKNVKSIVPLRVPYASRSAYSMHWSPDGARLAAYVDTYPASIIVYDTKTWKPLGQWACGQIMARSEFIVKQDGRLFQVMDDQINSLDLDAIKSMSD